MSSIADMPVKEWREAWTEIAVAFETEPEERTEEQRYVTRKGLCWAFLIVGDREIYDELTKFSQWGGQYWYAVRYVMGDVSKEDALRATHAAFFAAMTPKEFVEICGGSNE